MSETTATDTLNEDSFPSNELPKDPKPPAPVTVKMREDETGWTTCEGNTDRIGDKTNKRVPEAFVDRNLRPKITNSISSGPSLGEMTTASSNPLEIVTTMRISRVSTANECPFRDGPILAADTSPPTAPNPEPAMVILTTPEVVANTSDGRTEVNGVAQSNDEDTPVLSVNVPLGHAIQADADTAFSEEDHVLYGHAIGFADAEGQNEP